MSLTGKTIVVTGGSHGIGLAIASACAAQGARVVIASRSEEKLREAENAIAVVPGASVLAIRCDASNSRDLRELLTRSESEAGPAFGLVCAAGSYGAIGPFVDADFEEWQRGIEVNFLGVARTSHLFLPGMKQRGEGRVILFSGGGQGPYPRFSSYATAKGGVWRLAETVGAETAEFGVFVNAIAPGGVNSGFLDDLLAAGPEKAGAADYAKALKQKKEGGTPAARSAELALWLFSDAAKGLSGKILSANYDRYREITDTEAVSRSDLYTMRRVVNRDGGTRLP